MEVLIWYSIIPENLPQRKLKIISFFLVFWLKIAKNLMKNSLLQFFYWESFAWLSSHIYLQYSFDFYFYACISCTWAKSQSVVSYPSATILSALKSLELNLKSIECDCYFISMSRAVFLQFILKCAPSILSYSYNELWNFVRGKLFGGRHCPLWPYIHFYNYEPNPAM